MKTSVARFVSPGTRLVASDWNATTLPSPDTAAWVAEPSGGPPSKVCDTSRVAPPSSRMNTSRSAFARFVSSGTLESKATKRPSSEITGRSLEPPPAPSLIRIVRFAIRFGVRGRGCEPHGRQCGAQDRQTASVRHRQEGYGAGGRWPTSLNERSSSEPSAWITSRVMAVLSLKRKANGRLAVAWRQSSAMTPPCTKAATLTPAPTADTISSTPRRTRVANAVHRLRAGQHLPVLLAHRPQDQRVPVPRADAELPALPVAQRHLGEVRERDRLEAGGGHERRRGLVRPPQGRREDRRERLVREPPADQLRLLAPGLRQRRIAATLEQLVALAGDRRRRGAVPHQHDLGRVRRYRVSALLVLGQRPWPRTTCMAVRRRIFTSVQSDQFPA